MAADQPARGGDPGAVLLNAEATLTSSGGGPIAAPLRGVSKRFGMTVALDGVSLEVRRGTVHALLGENGAGKSTLVKILTGVVVPDLGEVVVDGLPRRGLTPKVARSIGIARVAQELSLFPDLTVAANVAIGREPRRGLLVDRRAMRAGARAMLDQLGVQLDVDGPVRRLALAERQLVEIAKAMSWNPKVLVLDEPTSGLRETEVEQLFAVIRRLRDHGTAVVFISHRMDEVFAIADHISVLKDGRNSGEVSRDRADPDTIVRMMVGREVTSQFPPLPPAVDRMARRAGEPALTAVGLSVPGTMVQDVDLQLWPGEVCGIAGLQGQGQAILLEALFGLRRAHGEVRVGTARGPFRHPNAAIAAGVALVPEDRKDQGSHLDLPVRANVTLPTLGESALVGMVRSERERQRARDAVTALAVRPADPELPVRALSGGNQQKVVLAKWLETRPSALLLADPTRGVDVGTKQEMYRLVREQADAGVAVLLLSTELLELLGLCDRITVMSGGRLVASVDNDGLTEEDVMRLVMEGAA